MSSPSSSNECHHWYAGSSRRGTWEGAWRERVAVWGREREWARVVKGAWVSPRPWKRMRRFESVLEGEGV